MATLNEGDGGIAAGRSADGVHGGLDLPEPAALLGFQNLLDEPRERQDASPHAQGSEDEVGAGMLRCTLIISRPENSSEG